MHKLLASTFLLLFGCAYASIDPSSTALLAPADPGAHVWVLTPQDGAYGGRVYRGSGLAVARETLSAVREIIPLAQRAALADERSALLHAAQQGVDLIVSADIRHWENRATNWSGMRDKVRVEVRLLQVSPPKMLSRVRFESRNNSITLIDGRPEDLLDRDFAKAVHALF